MNDESEADRLLSLRGNFGEISVDQKKISADYIQNLYKLCFN